MSLSLSLRFGGAVKNSAQTGSGYRCSAGAALQKYITCCNGTRQGDLLSSKSSLPDFLVNSKCRDNDGVSTGHVLHSTEHLLLWFGLLLS